MDKIRFISRNFWKGFTGGVFWYSDCATSSLRRRPEGSGVDSDWKRVGQQIRRAMNEHASQSGPEQEPSKSANG